VDVGEADGVDVGEADGVDVGEADGVDVGEASDAYAAVDTEDATMTTAAAIRIGRANICSSAPVISASVESTWQLNCRRCAQMGARLTSSRIHHAAKAYMHVKSILPICLLIARMFTFSCFYLCRSEPHLGEILQDKN
jgi:hypothetical protein